MYLVRNHFHSRPIAHYVRMYTFVWWLVTFPAPDALVMCLHISVPIVSNDLVTARQPCNLLSQLSTSMDVEHSLCVCSASKHVRTHVVCYHSCGHAWGAIWILHRLWSCADVRMVFSLQDAWVNCAYIIVHTLPLQQRQFTGSHFELYLMALPLCSGALVPSLVCVYLPRMCSLHCQLHSLLTYMNRFDVLLTLLSLVCHCMWCTGMLHSLNYILVYTCLWCTWVVLWQLPVVVRWLTALHAPCVSPWWPVCLHWTWDTLCCGHCNTKSQHTVHIVVTCMVQCVWSPSLWQGVCIGVKASMPMYLLCS